MSLRLPRFKRVLPTAAMQLTPRDHQILQLIHRHRFLRSYQIVALLGGSPQPILRRLQSLYHHGFIERPRAQIQYYERGGSKSIVYGLGNKGGAWLRQELGIAVVPDSWGEKNHSVGRVFLEHSLLVSDVMLAVEVACLKYGIKLLHEDQLALPNKTQLCRWRVKMPNGMQLGVIPDRVFALEYPNATGQPQRAYFFLEADRGTMPVVRQGLAQTSFYRKLLAYEATWTQKVHQRYLGFPRFRVLAVTMSAARVSSLLEACSQLRRGHGLFLFADKTILEKDLLSAVWRNGKTGDSSPLLDLPNPASPAVS